LQSALVDLQHISVIRRKQRLLPPPPEVAVLPQRSSLVLPSLPRPIDLASISALTAQSMRAKSNRRRIPGPGAAKGPKTLLGALKHELVECSNHLADTVVYYGRGEDFSSLLSERELRQLDYGGSQGYHKAFSRRAVQDSTRIVNRVVRRAAEVLGLEDLVLAPHEVTDFISDQSHPLSPLNVISGMDKGHRLGAGESGFPNPWTNWHAIEEFLSRREALLKLAAAQKGASKQIQAGPKLFSQSLQVLRSGFDSVSPAQFKARIIGRLLSGSRANGGGARVSGGWEIDSRY